jgi:lipoprotein-anchoring transpeptidase ErfK/SrfK
LRAVKFDVFSKGLRGLCVLAVVGWTGCSSVPEAGIAFDSAEGLVSRYVDTGKRNKKIVVDLSRQTATLYRGDTVIGVSPVSTGREGNDTPPGRYKVIQKDADHRSNLYGNYVKNGRVVKRGVDFRKTPKPPGAVFDGAPMRYFLRFSGAYGLHAGILPGYPASAGCVRLPERQARRFYYAVDLGTPVIVKR